VWLVLVLVLARVTGGSQPGWKQQWRATGLCHSHSHLEVQKGTSLIGRACSRGAGGSKAAAGGCCIFLVAECGWIIENSNNKKAQRAQLPAWTLGVGVMVTADTAANPQTNTKQHNKNTEPPPSCLHI